MKQFIQSLAMGSLGSLAVFISFLFNLPTWVLFLGWVCYYLFDSDIKSILLTILQICLGIFVAILIQNFGTQLSLKIGNIGLYFSVFIIIGLLFNITRLEYLNNLPAYFIGMIIWFGSNELPNIKTYSLLSITVFIGYVFAITNSYASQQLTHKQKI